MFFIALILIIYFLAHTVCFEGVDRFPICKQYTYLQQRRSIKGLWRYRLIRCHYQCLGGDLGEYE